MIYQRNHTKNQQSDITNQHIALYLFEELWNNRNKDVIDQLFSKEFEAFSPSNPNSAVTNLDGFKKGVDLIFKTFPNMTFQMDDVINEGNKIVIRWHGEGEQTQSFFEEPCDPRNSTYAGLLILVIEEGHIQKAWLMDNSFELAETYH